MIGLVLVAAGSSTRFSSPIPKQFMELSGKPLFLHSLETFAPFVEEAILVVPSGWSDRVREATLSIVFPRTTKIVVGGQRRQDSVWKGLEALSQDIEFVLVHDAARPHVSSRVVERTIAGTRKGGACVPVVPIVDTVKEVGDGQVVRTWDRSRLRCAQTPQGFRVDLLKKAFLKCGDRDVTDDAGLLEFSGMRIYTVEGEVENSKITSIDDWADGEL